MRRFFRPILVGIALVVILIATHYLRWLAPAENLLVKVLAPAQERLYGLTSGLRNFHNNWLTKRDLLAENEQLAEKLKNYQIDQAKLNNLQAENDLLKKELNFVQEEKTKFISAQIVTGVSDPASQSVVINRGAKDGLTKGLAVVEDSGILLGKIYKVSDNFSTVLLLTDNNSKVAAMLQNSTKTAGLVEGQFGLSFSMTNIPQTEAVQVGDLVVTSGLEGQIPKGLLIAEVATVKEVESEIFKTAILKPIISFADLSYVLVILP